jgi:HSP20 family protein
MDRLINDLSRSSMYGLAPQPSFPRLNVWEQDDALVAEAEVPGVSDADLEVVATGNELTSRGARAAADGDDSTYHRRERSTGKFARTVRLSVDINSSKVEAKLSNGVLRIVLPKAAAAQPRTISVTTSK